LRRPSGPRDSREPYLVPGRPAQGWRVLLDSRPPFDNGCRFLVPSATSADGILIRALR